MFSRPINLVRIFGIQLKLDPSWLLIAALIVWSLSFSYFPQTYPGLEGRSYLTLSVAGMLGLFGSLILHELSHALMARRFGLGIGGITLFLFGGVAELESEPEDPLSEFWIAIVGPVTSLALAAIFWFLHELITFRTAPAALSAVIGYLAGINLVLAIFNLLPAFPLDGGRILRAFLWYRSGEIIKATRTATSIASGIAIALIALGFLALFAGSQLGGIWQVLIGLFLLIAARSTYQEVLNKTALKGKDVASIMSDSLHVAAPTQTLDQLVNQIMLKHSVSFVPVVEQDALLGYIDNSVLKKIDRENWENTQVGDVFVALEADQTVPPDLAVKDLLEKISKTGRRKFMVTKEDRLVGIVSLSDLTAYLSVFAAIGPKIRTGSYAAI